MNIMDRNANCFNRGADDTFAQFCLQSLAPLINYPFNSEDKEIIKSQNTPCNCSKSGCLKLYCECFAKGRYCIGCNCINCFNVPDYESIRSKAVAHLVQRNSEAFIQEKVITKGCTCKKSGCVKKYCKCHLHAKKCDDTCKCVGCQNLG